MLYLLIFSVGVATLLLFPKKREMKVGSLIYHKESEVGGLLIIKEKVSFQNAVDCVKHYNDIIHQFSEATSGYPLDSWTYNQFEDAQSRTELFRFGKYIELKKTIALK